VEVLAETDGSYKFKTKPYGHQKECLGKLLHEWEGSGALFLEPGLGKSWIFINHAGALHHYEGIRRVLYVGPRGVLSTIAEQIEEHLWDEIPCTVRILRGRMKQKVQGITELNGRKKRLRFILVNYESVWRKPLKRAIKKWRPQLIIADESHKIKRYGAKQTRGMLNLARSADYRVISTGTAVTRNHLDIREQWRFMLGNDDDNLPNEHWKYIEDFRHRYASQDMYGRVRKVKRPKEMRRIIRSRGYIGLKDECLDLPEKTFETVYVDLEPKAKRIYQEMATQMVAKLEEAKESDDPMLATASIVLVMRLRLSQITSGFVKNEDGEEIDIGSEKNEATAELVDTIVSENQRKLIIFYRFRREGAQLANMLTNSGVSWAKIEGGLDDEERDQIRKDFQGTDDPQVLLSNIQVGGLGITLTAAREMVFFNIPQGLDHYIQAQDRIHRIGQEHKVTYYHIIGRGTIDEESLTALERKKDIADIILENPSVLLLKEHLIDSSGRP